MTFQQLDALDGRRLHGRHPATARRVREWLASPAQELMGGVQRTQRQDKGTVNPARKLDELRRAKTQECIGRRMGRAWPGPAGYAPRLNIADAMAWRYR